MAHISRGGSSICEFRAPEGLSHAASSVDVGVDGLEAWAAWPGASNELQMATSQLEITVRVPGSRADITKHREAATADNEEGVLRMEITFL